MVACLAVRLRILPCSQSLQLTSSPTGRVRFRLPRLSGARSNRLKLRARVSITHLFIGGDERNRTADPLLARQVLSQLSYTPVMRSFLLLKIAQHYTFARLRQSP